MVNEKMNYNVKISKLASNSFFMKGKTKKPPAAASAVSGGL